MTQYRAQQDIAISCFESGTEIELKMVVTFRVQPGSPATQIDPPEYPSVEIDTTRFFRVKDGNTAADEVTLPTWMADALSEGDDLHAWLLSEASEQAEADREDAAEARRDELREDRL